VLGQVKGWEDDEGDADAEAGADWGSESVTLLGPFGAVLVK
jgi:hypothetical protein